MTSLSSIASNSIDRGFLQENLAVPLERLISTTKECKEKIIMLLAQSFNIGIKVNTIPKIELKV